MNVTNQWRARHLAYRGAPDSPADRKVIKVLDAIAESVDDYLASGGRFPDANSSEAYGQMIEGVVQLLNEKLVHLDAGMLWDECEFLANKVHWSLDDSEVDYAS